MKELSLTLIVVVSFTAITSLLIGYDLCIVSSVISRISNEFNLCSGSGLDCFTKQFFVSMLPPGAVIGSLCSGLFSDFFGRKKGLMLSDLLIAVGSVLFYFGPSYAYLLLGRFIIGIGVGAGFVVFSIYVPEISPPAYRGGLVAAQDCALSIGCLISYMLILVIPPKEWRILLGGVGVLAIIQFVGAIFLPESPRWLVRKDRPQDALKSVKKLLPKNKSADTFSSMEMVSITAKAEETIEKISREYAFDKQIQEQRYTQDCAADNDKTIELSLKQRFCHSWKLCKQYKNQLAVAVGCAVAQNFTVSNSVMYFAVDILSHTVSDDTRFAGIGIGVMKFLGIFSVILLVDRVGRRVFLLYGSITTCVCLFIISLLFALQYWANFMMSWLLISVLMLYIYAWNISWAGLMFVVASEVLNTAIRGIGMALTVTMFWTLSFVFQTTLEPTIAAWTAQGAFFFYGCLNILTILFVKLYIKKDYSGMVLEDIHS